MSDIKSPPNLDRLRLKREQRYQQIYNDVLYWRGVVNACRDRLVGAQVHLDVLEAELIKLSPDNPANKQG